MTRPVRNSRVHRPDPVHRPRPDQRADEVRELASAVRDELRVEGGASGRDAGDAERLLDRSLRALEELSARPLEYPAQLQSDAATRQQLDDIRDAALASSESRAASLSEALQPVTMPTPLRFHEARMLDELLTGAEQQSRADFEDSFGSVLARELGRVQPIPEVHDSADLTPDVADRPRVVEALSQMDSGVSSSDGSESGSLEAGATRSLEAPGLLWGRIRADIRAIRKARHLAQRHRQLSRLSIAAAVVVLGVILWPTGTSGNGSSGDLEPSIDIQVTVVDQPFDEGFSALGVMRRLHDGQR